MPIENFIYRDKEYFVITHNKIHEAAFRLELSNQLVEKFGGPLPTELNLSAMTYAFNYYAQKLESSIRQIEDVTLIIYIYELHEQSAELSRMNQDNYEIPIDYSYYSIYRRVLKLILQESTFIDFKRGDWPDRDWTIRSTHKIEELLYLGQLLLDVSNAISEISTVGNFIQISFPNGLYVFQHYPAWGHIIDIVNDELQEEFKDILINTHIDDDFEVIICKEIGFALNDLRGALNYLNDTFHSKHPPELYDLNAILTVMEQLNDTGELFVNGLILNRRNATRLSGGVNKPYLGNNRLNNRPILTLTLNGEEILLVDMYTFEEALNNFFQSSISFGKLPDEWQKIPSIVALKNRSKQTHKDLLEDEIEKILSEKSVVYDRNIITLKCGNNQNTPIEKDPGEIDFIFILDNIIYLADCKLLTRRYEMRGFADDVSKFQKSYNARLELKLDFLKENKLKFQKHFQLLYNNPTLDIMSLPCEGIFILNTFTMYMLNAPYKLYTLKNFKSLINGSDFFKKYIPWINEDSFGTICYPFVDGFRAAMPNFV